MPLSEEELRLLEQMERALAAEDPKFASALRGRPLGGSARRRLLLAAGVFGLGIVVLMGGVISPFWWIGIVGFLMMLGSALWGLASLHRARTAVDDPAAGFGFSEHPSGFGVVDGGRAARRSRRHHRGASFMQRVEERWERRRNQGY